MQSEYTVFAVDDVDAGRFMIESAFGQLYTVETFPSGAACIERMAVKIPDLFMLDVDMPEMDGFTLCRYIKSQASSTHVPVIFISALDDLESRLTGYDAGGDDFIAKPVKLAILKQKVEVLRRIAEEKSALRSRLDESDMLTTLVLSNLDEYAVLIKFLRSLNKCERYANVAEAVLTMLKEFRLEGAVQLRLATVEMTINHAGEVSPLHSSIIKHVCSQGTIAEFKNRAAFNFEHVSVLVDNMPLSDPDACGRLKDHLAIAVETVEEKLLALQTRQENAQTKDEIASLLQSLGSAIHAFSKKYEDARFAGSETTRLMLDELATEFVSLGMREVQEESIKEIILSRTDQLTNIFDLGAETEATLNELSVRLNKALGSRS
ncbi:MAG: response regulator [Betaproteobacteria bacterium]